MFGLLKFHFVPYIGGALAQAKAGWLEMGPGGQKRGSELLISKTIIQKSPF